MNGKQHNYDHAFPQQKLYITPHMHVIKTSPKRKLVERNPWQESIHRLFTLFTFLSKNISPLPYCRLEYVVDIQIKERNLEPSKKG